MHIDPKSYDKVKSDVENSANMFGLPFMNISRSDPGQLIQELETEIFHPSQWICTNCGNLTPNSSPFCLKCHSTRILESFESLYTNPLHASPSEISILNSRRNYEKQIISKRDLLAKEIIETDDNNYLIDAEWLADWKAFIFNKPRKYSCAIINPEIGVLPPGPISNYLLFTKDRITPRPNLQKVLHFIQNIYNNRV